VLLESVCQNSLVVMADRLLIGIEPTKLCNLNCVHCLRSNTDAREEISIDLLARIFEQARVYGSPQISLTGGEPTLHSRFFEILDLVREHGFRCNVASNGHNFLGLVSRLEPYKDVLPCMSFSLDGANAETHDHIRGAGAFQRVLLAIATARYRGFGVTVQLAINRLNRAELSQVPDLCKSLGVQALFVCHTQPTHGLYQADLQLDPDAWRAVEKEVGQIARTTDGVKPQLSIGAWGPGVPAPCLALQMRSLNIDYRGRLTFCCQLSGVADSEVDVVADLNEVSLVDAHHQLFDLTTRVIKERLTRITSGTLDGVNGFHCWYCNKRFDKLDWMRRFPDDPWIACDPELARKRAAGEI